MAKIEECKGHGWGDLEYADYVKQMVSDFKKANGGYITAFLYIDEAKKTQLKVAKPFCRYEAKDIPGICKKPISKEQLMQIVAKIDPTDGKNELEKEFKNLARVMKEGKDELAVAVPKLNMETGHLVKWDAELVDHTVIMKKVELLRFELAAKSDKSLVALLPKERVPAPERLFLEALVAPPCQAIGNEIILMTRCEQYVGIFDLFDNSGHKNYNAIGQDGRLRLNHHYIASPACRGNPYFRGCNKAHSICETCVPCDKCAANNCLDACILNPVC